MKRGILIYCGLICCLLAFADDGEAKLWVGESHTFSVDITYVNQTNKKVYWEDMRWEYESGTDNDLFSINASPAESTSKQATATVSLLKFFPETKHVIFRYTEVTRTKNLHGWHDFKKEYSKSFAIDCNKVGVTFDSASISVVRGNSQNLQWELSPTPPASSPAPTVTFSSSNNDIASVDANGCVTGKATGKTTIIAETNYATSASCTINVTPIKVTSISVEPSAASLIVGSQRQFSTIVLPDDADNQSLTWSSNNTAVATIDANGVVTAKSKGLATITAKANDGSNVTGQCSIVVLEGDANGDGIVDVADMNILIDIILGKIVFD